MGIQKQLQWPASIHLPVAAGTASAFGAISHIWRVRPFYAVLTAMVVGGGLIPLSIVAGVASVMDATVDPPRQVGFLNAFNWWVVYSVIFPLFVLALYLFLAEVRRLFRRLARLGMLVDSQGNSVSGDALQAGWDRTLHRVAPATLVLAVIVFSIIMRDWYYTNFVPLYVHGDLETMRAAMPRLPLDWSTAALFAEEVRPLPNVLFSFVAYAVQAASIVVFAHLVVFCIALGTFLERHSRTDAPTRIVPNPRLLEARMGLGAFQRLISLLLLMFTAVFGVSYAVRLWQQYLRSGHPSSLAFLQSEFSHGLWPETINGLPAVIPNLLYPGVPDSYAQTATLALALSSAIVSIVFVLLMIQLVIQRGRRSMLRRLAEESPRLHHSGTGGGSEDIRRLVSLSDWPLEKPSRNQTVSFMILLLAVVVMYRLALVLVLVMALVLLQQAFGFLNGYASGRN